MFLKINTHIPTRASSSKINWNLQIRHEPPAASVCPLGNANMESQVTILATLPRSDTIQMKSRRFVLARTSIYCTSSHDASARSIVLRADTPELVRPRLWRGSVRGDSPDTPRTRGAAG